MYLANAPGNALVDDKAMYVTVPDLIWYYLDEKPLLESVPTYRTSIESERLSVLDRVGELVTKPVDGEGGRGVLIGPSASAPEVAERRRAIAADPAAWVGQEVVQLSSHPTIGPSGLEPRHVDLRAFVYATGTGPEDVHLADVALTRVAPEGSMVVNSSQGGGAKGHVDHGCGSVRPDRCRARLPRTDGHRADGHRTDRRSKLMCGLAGEIRFDGRAPDVGVVARMTGCMSHRGRDGDGLWARGARRPRAPSTLVHRPLHGRRAADGPARGGPDDRLQRHGLQLPAAP